MIHANKLRTLLAAGAFAVAGAGAANADFINTGFEYVSNWDALTASYFSGIAKGGFMPADWTSGIAPTSGWNSIAKASNSEDNATYIAADKPVELVRTSGSHYAAGMGLYAFNGSDYSTFDFNVSTDVSNWETVVFQERKGPNPDLPSTAPVLVVDGQRYTALGSQILFAGSTWVDAIGQEVTIQDIAYQWDLRGLDLSNGFTIEYEVAIHEAMIAYQIAGSESFAIVVPEPSTYAMILGGVVLAGVCINRRRNSK